MRLPLRLIAEQATYFLCFAKESKQRKATPTCRFAAHPFFGACELAALRASSNKRTLVPEKRMLRSAGRRGGAAASNSCEALGSLKIGGWFQAAFGIENKLNRFPEHRRPQRFHRLIIGEQDFVYGGAGEVAQFFVVLDLAVAAVGVLGGAGLLGGDKAALRPPRRRARI